jgi:hypothetical protein
LPEKFKEFARDGRLPIACGEFSLAAGNEPYFAGASQLMSRKAFAE